MNDQQRNNLNQPGKQEKNKAQGAANTNENADSSAVNLDNSRPQTQAEPQQDKKGDQSKEDNSITSSGVDDLQSSNGRAGTDTAGAAEQKTYGDINLNKGLEAQAKDEES